MEFNTLNKGDILKSLTNEYGFINKDEIGIVVETREFGIKIQAKNENHLISDWINYKLADHDFKKIGEQTEKEKLADEIFLVAKELTEAEIVLSSRHIYLQKLIDNFLNMKNREV